MYQEQGSADLKRTKLSEKDHKKYFLNDYKLIKRLINREEKTTLSLKVQAGFKKKLQSTFHQ